MSSTLEQRSRSLSATNFQGKIRTHFPFWDAQLRPKFLEALRRFPVDKLGYKPRPEMMTARQIGVHIAEGEYGWMEHMVNGAPYQEWVIPYEDPSQGLWSPHDTFDHDALFAFLETWHRPTQRWLDAPESELTREFRRSRNGEEQRMTLHWILDRMYTHEAHHRAQLHFYLRSLGIEPPGY